ncbi:hypothetical protein IMY05_014G0111500 [Salix suchowensis]|nr:hypothetical protein IMY05_014G0111500 [Salix suchowensis]
MAGFEEKQQGSGLNGCPSLHGETATSFGKGGSDGYHVIERFIHPGKRKEASK